MSRWESPTFNSCLVGSSMADSPVGKSGSGSAPLGGTRNFSHHVLAASGIAPPPKARELAWRMSFIMEHGGFVSSGGVNEDIQKWMALPEAEKLKKRLEGAKHVEEWAKTTAPKRLASYGKTIAANDPELIGRVERGKEIDKQAWDEWVGKKEAQRQAVLKAKEADMAKIAADVEAMMERRQAARSAMPVQSVNPKTGKKGKSAKQKLIDEQMLLLKKQQNPLGQPIRLRLPKVRSSSSGNNSRSSSSLEQQQPLAIMHAGGGGGKNTSAQQQQQGEEGEEAVVCKGNSKVGESSSRGVGVGASQVSDRTSNYEDEADFEGEEEEQEQEQEDAAAVTTGALTRSGGPGGGTAAAPPPAAGVAPTTTTTTTNGHEVQVAVTGLKAMVELCQATSDPYATPSVSAAKALVMEEQLGLFAQIQKQQQQQQQQALVPPPLQGGGGGRGQRGGGGGGGGGAGGGGASSASTSSSSPSGGSGLDWNHRFMVPDKLHFVAPKDGKSVAGRKSSSSSPGKNSSNHHAGGGGSLLSGMDSSNKPKTSWEGFSGTGGGGDGSGAGTGSAEPWDYGDLFASAPP